jgi:hypothetical protein
MECTVELNGLQSQSFTPNILAPTGPGLLPASQMRDPAHSGHSHVASAAGGPRHFVLPGVRHPRRRCPGPGRLDVCPERSKQRVVRPERQHPLLPLPALLQPIPTDESGLHRHPMVGRLRPPGQTIRRADQPGRAQFVEGADASRREWQRSWRAAQQFLHCCQCREAGQSSGDGGGKAATADRQLMEWQQRWRKRTERSSSNKPTATKSVLIL